MSAGTRAPSGSRFLRLTDWRYVPCRPLTIANRKDAFDGSGKLDQLEWLFDHHLRSERILGTRKIVVSRHEQNGALGLGGSDSRCELAAIHHGHHKVDQGQVNVVPFPDRFERNS